MGFFIIDLLRIGGSLRNWRRIFSKMLKVVLGLGSLRLYLVSLVELINTIYSLILSRIFQIGVSHLPRCRSSDAPTEDSEIRSGGVSGDLF